jgi:hypothetical protein
MNKWWRWHNGNKSQGPVHAFLTDQARPCKNQLWMHFSPRRPYTHELLISLKTECATRFKDNREQKNSTKNKTEESMYDCICQAINPLISVWLVLDSFICPISCLVIIVRSLLHFYRTNTALNRHGHICKEHQWIPSTQRPGHVAICSGPC